MKKSGFFKPMGRLSALSRYTSIYEKNKKTPKLSSGFSKTYIDAQWNKDNQSSQIAIDDIKVELKSQKILKDIST